MLSFWNHAVSALRDDLTTTLIWVVDHRGSVPGTTGARLVVTPAASVGTVGGGILEKEVIDRALSFAGDPELITFEHSPDGVGSLCAGTQTVAIMALTHHDLPTLEAIDGELSGGGIGTLRLGAAGISFTAGKRSARSFTKTAETWSYVETLGNLETLYLIGGGHVALALSRVMATLPFRIVVLDDREGLPTMRDNTFAHESRVVQYDSIARHIPENTLTYAVIMTHAHEHDEIVLEQLVGKELAYLGMLGSATKVRQLYANLEGRGVARSLLDRVRSPAGIAIGSHSPEEIAVSIAAEIVKVRNERAAAGAGA